jgi:hypothetical protein
MDNGEIVNQTGSRLISQLGSRAYLSVSREEITNAVRQVTGNPEARVSSGRLALLEGALTRSGIRCFPSLRYLEDPQMRSRLYRRGSVSEDLLVWHLFPAPENDAKLGEVLAKVKGHWRWPSI